MHRKGHSRGMAETSLKILFENIIERLMNKTSHEECQGGKPAVAECHMTVCPREVISIIVGYDSAASKVRTARMCFPLYCGIVIMIESSS